MSTEKSMDVMDTPDFRLEGILKSPEVSADGFTNLFFGFPNTRVVFHSIVEPPQTGMKEQRRAVLTLTLPTMLAIQLAQTIISGAKANEQVLIQTVDQQAKNFKRLIATQPTMAQPQGLIEKAIIQPPKPKE